jgi:hypothetical protein
MDRHHFAFDNRLDKTGVDAISPDSEFHRIEPKIDKILSPMQEGE